MTRKSIFSSLIAILIAFSFVLFPINQYKTYASTGTTWILLTDYARSLSVKEEFYLVAVTSSGKKPTFKSSDSKVASVNTYGLVTAKKAGSCKITVKSGSHEAYCRITVVATSVNINKSSITLENGQTFKLSVTSSTGNDVKWKSSKSSIAAVDENGLVTAKKAGAATITATVDGVSKTCKVTVKSPVLSLSVSKKTLFRTQSFRLTANVSSGKKVVWKSNKSSVATVNENGVVKAVKHGTATITATVDGVPKSCTVTVAQPKIKLSCSTLSLKAGEQFALTAEVSSGLKPTWSSSNINVVEVDENGNIYARQKGKAYIYAKEDGVKVSCIVNVADSK